MGSGLCRRSLLVWCLAGLLGLALAAEDPPITEALPDARIEIYKADRKLLLYSGDELVRSYPVGLGFEPIAAKVRQGDGATPEGDYVVCVKNPQSRYYLSLGINYPNSRDAARGLKSKLISKAQHDAIVRADERGVCPAWNTRLGGEIFIHGRGSGADWTLGCVALDDPAMKEVFTAVGVGAPVSIRP